MQTTIRFRGGERTLSELLDATSPDDPAFLADGQEQMLTIDLDGPGLARVVARLDELSRTFGAREAAVARFFAPSAELRALARR